jgi:glucose/mannose transport system permease protein
VRTRAASLLILLPAIVASLIFVYGFIAWTGFASITGWDQIKPLKNFLPDFPVVGLENYASLFRTPRFWPNDLMNNAVFTVGFVGFSLALGVVLAILLDQRIRGESFFRNLFLFPMSLSYVVTGTIWSWIFNPNIGINQLLDPLWIGAFRETLLQLGFLSPLWAFLDGRHVNIVRPGLTADPRAALGAIVVAAVWQSSGFVMAMFLAGLRGIPDEVREAARVDGASELQVYRRILLPMLGPVFVSTVVLLGYISLKVFDLVFVTTRGGPDISSDFPSIFLFDSAFKSNLWARGAATACVMLIASAVLVIPYLRWQLRREGRR